MNTTPKPKLDQIAERIRKLSEQVDDPADWTVVLPAGDYHDVIQLLDTSRDMGTYYDGIAIRYGDDCNEAKVKLKRSLSGYLDLPCEGGDDGE